MKYSTNSFCSKCIKYCEHTLSLVVEMKFYTPPHHLSQCGREREDETKVCEAWTQNANTKKSKKRIIRLIKRHKQGAKLNMNPNWVN